MNDAVFLLFRIDNRKPIVVVRTCKKSISNRPLLKVAHPGIARSEKKRITKTTAKIAIKEELIMHAAKRILVPTTSPKTEIALKP